MKRHDSKREVLARTKFMLTRDEVIEALTNFVIAKGGKVPDGGRDVWISPPPCEEVFATLAIDRNDEEANAPFVPTPAELEHRRRGDEAADLLG